jgi:phosphopentomutase
VRPPARRPRHRPPLHRKTRRLHAHRKPQGLRLLPDEKTILERLVAKDVPVYAVGKIEDIYCHRGITESVHTGNNADSQALVEKWTQEKTDGLIMANFIDYDMIYGHRRDAKGYAGASS